MKTSVALVFLLFLGCATSEQDPDRQQFVSDQVSEASSRLKQRLAEHESTRPATVEEVQEELAKQIRETSGGTVRILKVSSEQEQRREDFIDRHPSLHSSMKTAIRQGQILIGMTDEQVFAAWGKPARKTVDSEGYQFWNYGSVDLTFQKSVLVRWINYNAK